MKLHLLDRSNTKNSSFTVKSHKYPYFLKVWHYHPELELVLIKKSTGTSFIGDNIEKFEEMDVVIIGKNLPHMWVNDEAYFGTNSELIAEAIGIHFSEDFLGSHFFEVPEMLHIGQMLKRANQGIKFYGIADLVIDKINSLLDLEDFSKSIALLEVLNNLAKHKNYKLLSSAGYKNAFDKTDDKSLDKIYAFVFKNFTNNIGSKDVAKVANMNASAFSRYFKRIHRKTFTRYLNEIRIGYACKLILENKFNITGICYESGFNNISNFNRQFKNITGFSPSEYIAKHIKI